MEKYELDQLLDAARIPNPARPELIAEIGKHPEDEALFEEALHAIAQAIGYGHRKLTPEIIFTVDAILPYASDEIKKFGKKDGTCWLVSVNDPHFHDFMEAERKRQKYSE